MGGQWHHTSRRIHTVLWKGDENHQLGTVRFAHKGIMSEVKKAEFLSDRISYIILKGRWFDITVGKFHTPTEDKIVYVKDSCYEELESIYDKFPEHEIEIQCQSKEGTD
jgi:hypothetical protein